MNRCYYPPWSLVRYLSADYKLIGNVVDNDTRMVVIVSVNLTQLSCARRLFEHVAGTGRQGPRRVFILEGG